MRSNTRRAAGAVLTEMAVLALLVLAAAPVSAASPPANDLVANAQALTLNVPVDFDSTNATMSAGDPTDCNGSHGPWAGPYYASVWFSYKATNRDKYLSVWAPTTQGRADDYLAITFVYAVSGNTMQLVDCTAFGNDVRWAATAGTTYVIMEAGLSSAATDYPPLSDRGGRGTIVVTSSSTSMRFSGMDRFHYEDCGVPVDVTATDEHTFSLKSGRHGDATPYYFDNYEWHAVSRNPDNGKWFREDGQGLYKDLTITKVEGTVYTFVSQETGRPYTLTDMNGNRVFFDHGRLLTTFQVDTKGDADLSNDEFIEGSFALLAENGDHPNWFWDGDWCTDIVIPLLGD